jgi:hypothetical protein
MAQMKIGKTVFAITAAIGITSVILLGISVAVGKALPVFSTMSATELNILRTVCLAITVFSLVVAGRRNARKNKNDQYE